MWKFNKGVTIMKKDLNQKILNSIIVVGIVLTIIALVAMPLGLTAMMKAWGEQMSITKGNMPLILSCAIYICAIPYLIGLFKLKKICKLLRSQNKFSVLIVKELRDIGICAFSEAIIFIFMTVCLYGIFGFYLYALTILSLIIIPFVSIALSLLFFQMSEVFKIAVEIKEENDLIF